MEASRRTDLYPAPAFSDTKKLLGFPGMKSAKYGAYLHNSEYIILQIDSGIHPVVDGAGRKNRVLLSYPSRVVEVCKNVQEVRTKYPETLIVNDHFFHRDIHRLFRDEKSVEAKAPQPLDPPVQLTKNHNLLAHNEPSLSSGLGSPRVCQQLATPVSALVSSGTQIG